MRRSIDLAASWAVVVSAAIVILGLALAVVAP